MNHVTWMGENQIETSMERLTSNVMKLSSIEQEVIQKERDEILRDFNDIDKYKKLWYHREKPVHSGEPISIIVF